MARRAAGLSVALGILAAACSPGGQSQPKGLDPDEHADRGRVDLAVNRAINEPGGGDWAEAVSIVRASDLPDDEKTRQIGRLVIMSHDHDGAVRPAETLAQGLDMIERSALRPGDGRRYLPQQLRLFFERGVGKPPAGIPVDQAVADCWRALEQGREGDPARCIALRKERLPQLSVDARQARGNTALP